MQPAKPAYGFRNDINGLRAWAVVAVLLFHFQVPGFSAGFIGVDIFFVISGFLMTGIILRGLEQGNFSLWQFYMARARRIIPALMLLLVVLLVLGWFWLPTPDYQTLGAQSAYSLSFLSNIHYWRSAGYFDSAAYEKWLLHTWSLGIEMQFYLLYPVFALLVWKIKSGVKTFAWSLVSLFVLSLALSVMASSWKRAAAFYLVPTGGWELAGGGSLPYCALFAALAATSQIVVHGRAAVVGERFCADRQQLALAFGLGTVAGAGHGVDHPGR